MQQLVLEMDQVDYDAILEAIAIRRNWRFPEGDVILPEDTEDTDGGIIAEICRGWLELRQAHEGQKGGDGAKV